MDNQEKIAFVHRKNSELEEFRDKIEVLSQKQQVLRKNIEIYRKELNSIKFGETPEEFEITIMKMKELEANIQKDCFLTVNILDEINEFNEIIKLKRQEQLMFLNKL